MVFLLFNVLVKFDMTMMVTSKNRQSMRLCCCAQIESLPYYKLIPILVFYFYLKGLCAILAHSVVLSLTVMFVNLQYKVDIT